ncbi:MAG: diguanylate cyclase [Actinomycetota bacterium]|jgi:PAS domain S-box-containing protein|nr:diguanylate cyclase [Actinomycetota bacterium]
MRLLIADDDAAVRRLVSNRLERQGVSVTVAETGATALAELRHTAFDVAILDLELPDGSGLDLLRSLRELDAHTHVIILSAVRSEADRVQALDLGADDYVVKPFFVRELTARVLAVRRRQDVTKDTMLRYGRIQIDLAARHVTIDDVAVSLTAKEFDLLAFLAARPRNVFSRDELLRAVWHSAADWQQVATVTEHVGRLRSKIEQNPSRPRLLQTVRGVGYRFDPPPLEQLDQGATIPAGHPPAGSEGIFVLVDGRIVAADEAAVVMLGVARETDLLGRELHELVAPHSLVAANAREHVAASGGSPRAQVMEVRRADEADIFVEVSSSRTDWHGQPARRLTMHPSTDPSARLRRLVTGVFSEVSDAVIVTDPHLHVRSWNQAAERLYGWAEHEVLGRHLFDVVPLAEDNDQLNSAMRTLEEKGRWFGEGLQIARDGSEVNVFASTTLLRDDRGEPFVFVSVNRQASAQRVLAASSPSDVADVADEGDIRRGLDCGEFTVHYQPVVAFDDRHIITVEALVRWNHPERGLLLPGSFIDAAERSGVILELGRVVFDTACRQAAEWRRGGSDLGVAVNLSTKQFADVALFDNITEVLTASGLDPRALWLEVTETALVEDLDQATQLLERLAALGIGITIDDFGTGWASLTYLKQFPVHALKIDQSFVAGIDRDPQDAAIARSIISLGRELDMMVVAEGIETLAQQSALQTLGCSFGQGFLYGRPVPAADVPVERANRL